MEDFVLIPASQYRELLERVDQLDLLECAGVDNWPGYGDMYDQLKYDYPDLEPIERIKKRDETINEIVRLVTIRNIWDAAFGDDK